MNKTQNLKKLYPLLAAGIALCGTAALFLGMMLSWLACCLAANVFFAAGMVCGTEVRTVRRKNPLAEFSEDEPEELEGRVFRVPLLSVLIGIAAALVCGLIGQSAVTGLLVLFTWGGLGIPLALCILYQTDFGLSLQTGLISSVVLTAIAGVIQIFISSPGHSFDPEYCFDQIVTRMTDSLTSALTGFKAAVEGGTAMLPGGQQGSDLFGLYTPEMLAKEAVTAFIEMTPALFAVGILTLSCIIWWGAKAALKKSSIVEIKHMGRLDGYVPGRILSPLYLLFVLLNLFSESGSGLQITAMNAVYVISAVLTFAGFSVVLYIINTRAPSVTARVLLTAATVAVSLSSCGGSLLLLLGLLSTGRDFRGTFGGGERYL